MKRGKILLLKKIKLFKSFDKVKLSQINVS
jgi:hypothetical protein